MPFLAGCLPGIRAEGKPSLVALSSRSFGLTHRRLFRFSEPTFLSSVLALPSGGRGFPYLTLRLGQILALKLRYHPTFKEGWIKPSKGKAEPNLQR